MTQLSQQRIGPIFIVTAPVQIAVERRYSRWNSKGLEQLLPDWIPFTYHVFLN